MLDKLPNLCYNKYVNKNKSHSRKELMTMEKITNVKALAYVLANTTLPEEVAEKLRTMKAQFEKKSSAERKPTENQKANAGFKTVILQYVGEVGKPLTISDIQKGCLPDLSGQRVSAIVTQLKNDGLVVRTEDKRKAYFSLAQPTEG